MGLILDSNSVVSLSVNRVADFRAQPSLFSQHTPEKFFYVTFTVAGEVAAGRMMAERERLQRLCDSYLILPWNLEVAWQYGETFRQLQSTGRMIGANDLWIAATALVHDLGVVTNNVQEFSRVDGLTALSY